MKAIFADLSERTRQQRADRRAYLADERAHVISLFDAVQVALARGQDDRVSILLKQVHAILVSRSTAQPAWTRDQRVNTSGNCLVERAMTDERCARLKEMLEDHKRGFQRLTSHERK